MLIKWRHEQDLRHRADHEAIVAPPQPITEPKGNLRFTRALFALALLVVVIVAFVGYVGFQLVRFSQVPAVAFDGPQRRELPADAQSAHLTGTSMPGFTIVLSGPGEFQKTVQAGEDTRWSIDIPVTKGQNDFTIVARDPTTNRDSAPVSLVVALPVPASPTSVPAAIPTSSAGIPIPAARLALTEPSGGAKLNVGGARVAGMTDAPGVTISATYVGPLGQPRASALPSGTSSAPRAPDGPGASSPLKVIPKSGTFSGSVMLAVGRWTLSATTTGSDTLASATQSVTVDVTSSGMVLVVEARGGSAWIEVLADGKLVQRGRTFRNGERKTFTARQTIVVRTGNAGATAYTFNGVDIGVPGTAGHVERWLFDNARPQPRRI
jgi:hypothetical protein